MSEEAFEQLLDNSNLSKNVQQLLTDSNISKELKIDLFAFLSHSKSKIDIDKIRTIDDIKNLLKLSNQTFYVEHSSPIFDKVKHLLEDSTHV